MLRSLVTYLKGLFKTKPRNKLVYRQHLRIGVVKDKVVCTLNDELSLDYPISKWSLLNVPIKDHKSKISYIAPTLINKCLMDTSRSILENKDNFSGLQLDRLSMEIVYAPCDKSPELSISSFKVEVRLLAEVYARVIVTARRDADSKNTYMVSQDGYILSKKEIATLDEQTRKTAKSFLFGLVEHFTNALPIKVENKMYLTNDFEKDMSMLFGQYHREVTNQIVSEY